MCKPGLPTMCLITLEFHLIQEPMVPRMCSVDSDVSAWVPHAQSQRYRIRGSMNFLHLVVEPRELVDVTPGAVARQPAAPAFLADAETVAPYRSTFLSTHAQGLHVDTLVEPREVADGTDDRCEQL